MRSIASHGLLVASLLVALCGLVPAAPVLAGADDGFPTTPVGNDGRRWRLAYYQGGDYVDYQASLIALIHGLMTLGWIEHDTLPASEGEAVKPLWKWLTENARSPYLEFVDDGFHDAGWDEEKHAAQTGSLLRRLSAGGDIDLVIAMGTWAGRALATDAHQMPTIVVSSSDPISAGIISSANDSGFDHVHAHTDPKLFERQVRLFHDITGFQRLGVAYEDTVEGRSYSGIGLVETVARELGFEIVRCHPAGDNAEQGEANASMISCLETLAPQVDGIYVTMQSGVNSNTLPRLVEIANAHNVPTFSQHGADEVEAGILLSMSSLGFERVGRFQAEVIAKVLNGASPRRLDQVYEAPPYIALNLDTSLLIGFVPPAYAIAATDEFFGSVPPPH